MYGSARHPRARHERTRIRCPARDCGGRQ